MSDFWRLITLGDPNTRVVLLGASLLGLTAGVIGTFTVLRRRALVGDALAHAALPGICAAYLIVGDKSLIAFLFGALVFGILGVLCISFIRNHTRIKEDAAIGIVLSSFFGFGIVLSRIIQNQPTGNRAGLDTFIFGKAAAMLRQDVMIIAIIAVVVLATVYFLFKELSSLCFDRDFAATQGWPVFALDTLLMGLICVCTVIGLPAVGVVLMAALLIIPAAAARFWTEQLSIMLVIAGGLGMASGAIGTAISALNFEYTANGRTMEMAVPTGPAVVLVATAGFLVSMLLAPQRGVIADLWRRHRLSTRIASQHVLRALYEIGEAAGDVSRPVSFDALLPLRSWSAAALQRELDRATAAGQVHAVPGGFALTDAGLAEAARLVRTHRLWETFLVSEASIAPDHVDRDADEIEHVLSPDLIARLEETLRRQGRLPGTSRAMGGAPASAAGLNVPTSPHPIGGPQP